VWLHCNDPQVNLDADSIIYTNPVTIETLVYFFKIMKYVKALNQGIAA